MYNNCSERKCYAIMQPYFLPYAGYFSLIKHTDHWIVFDETQYKRQSWGNRNRILRHPEGTTWFIAPTKKHKRGAFYSQIEIANNVDWKQKILRQLEYYKQKAPYFYEVYDLLEHIIIPPCDLLCDLSIRSLQLVCEYLDIPFNYEMYSSLNPRLEEIKHPGDWPIKICKGLGIKNYVNPSLGYFMFKEEDWIEENIELKFLKHIDCPYDQKRPIFEEKLSIIDVLMWNSVEEVHKILDSYRILSHTEIHELKITV